MTSERPIPNPSPLSQDFWEAAREHRLVRPYCARCEVSFFPPQLCCPECLETDWHWTESLGLGVVYSFTVVSKAPTGAFETPYIIAIVDLEDGFAMMSNIRGIDPEAVHIGLAVEVSWEHLDEVTLPVFEPRIEDGVRS